MAPPDKSTSHEGFAFASLMQDPLGSVLDATNRAAEQLKESASLFVAGFGAVLMVFAIVETLTFTGTDRRLSSGEFLAVLLCGLVLLLVGAGFRMFLGIEQAKGEEEFRTWVQERAAKEADAQIARGEKLTDKALEEPTTTDRIKP